MPTAPKKVKRSWKPERKPFQRNTNNSVYQTWKWRLFSKRYKEHNPLCIKCEREGRVTGTDVTDHIVRIEDGGAIWDDINLQPLCTCHHNSKSGKEAHGYKETK